MFIGGSLTESGNELVMANGAVCPPGRHGSVPLALQDTEGQVRKVLLERVEFLASAHCCLLSVRALIDAGSYVHLDEDGGTITGGRGPNVFTVKLQRDEGLWWLPTLTITPPLTTTTTTTTTTTGATTTGTTTSIAAVSVDPLCLHARLGHMPFAAMRQLGLLGPRTTLPFCEVCQLAKQKRQPISRQPAVVRETKPGRRLLCDLYGPCATALGGERFAVCFTDEASHFRVLRTLKTKDKVFDILEGVVADFVEAGVPVGRGSVLHGDNDSVLNSAAFVDLCHRLGLQQTFAPPYSPQLNGVAERAWDVLGGTTRALLKTAQLPESFWAFAMAHATFLGNVSPTTTLDGSTPYGFVHGAPFDYGRLRTFGCAAFVHVEPVGRGKFDDRARKGVYVGFNLKSHTHKVYFPSTGRVVSSMHATFNEGHFGVGGESSSNSSNSHHQDDGEGHTTPAVASGGGNGAGGNGAGGNGAGPLGHQPVPGTGGAGLDHAPAGGVAPAWVHQPDLVDPGSPDSPVSTAPPSPGPATAPGVLVVPGQGNFPYVTSSSSSDNSSSDSSSEDSDSDNEGHNNNNAQLLALRTLVAEAITTSQYPDDPTSLQQALETDQAGEWLTAVAAEHANLVANDTFDEVCRADVPRGAQVLPVKIVFKTKRAPDGSVLKYKCRAVVVGCRQRDTGALTYAPVAHLEVYRTFVAVAAQLGQTIHAMDCVAAYLNSEIDETVYIHAPPGMPVGLDERGQPKVYKLKKSIYGLRSSARAWHNTLDAFLTGYGMARSGAESAVYVFTPPGRARTTVCTFVDDLAVASADPREIALFKTAIMARFKMTDGGVATHYLGIEIDQQPGVTRLHQAPYIAQLLERQGMADCRPAHTPLAPNTELMLSTTSSPDLSSPRLSPAKVHEYRLLTGSLAYLATTSRPDLALAVHQLSRSLSAPTEQHQAAAQHVLRYLRGHPHRDMVYRENSSAGHQLQAFVDATWASERSSSRSVSGFLFQLAGGPVSWAAKLQTLIAHSSTEAEYVAASAAARECSWLRNVLMEIGLAQTRPTRLREDNAGVLALAQSPMTGQRSRHLVLREHHVREAQSTGVIALEYCPTSDNLADLCTKAVPRPLFDRLSPLVFDQR
jgi:hypothetical protein